METCFRLGYMDSNANKYIEIAKEFGETTACKYMRIANEFKEIGTTSSVLNTLSLNKLYTLASAPDEVKEYVANSKDKEEAENKIKEYEERLKQEKLARGVIELGQILIETKEGLDTEQFIQWLEDSRVGFKKSQAYKYIKIANEYDDIFSTSGGKILNQLSVNKLFELASAPEEVKEDVAKTNHNRF